MAAAEHVRREWEESAQALEAEARDRPRYEQLLEQVEVVTAVLRRRVGQTFTLGQLEGAYREAERWAAEALEEHGAPAWWPRTLSMVVGAAFHAYARGALDYGP